MDNERLGDMHLKYVIGFNNINWYSQAINYDTLSMEASDWIPNSTFQFSRNIYLLDLRKI